MDVDIDMRFCWRRGRWGIRYPSGCLNSAHFIVVAVLVSLEYSQPAY